jgi:hypothetical protein
LYEAYVTLIDFLFPFMSYGVSRMFAASLPFLCSITSLNFDSSCGDIGYVCSPSTGNEPDLTSFTYCLIASVDFSPILSYNFTNLR